jgi:hypothetical protein
MSTILAQIFGTIYGHLILHPLRKIYEFGPDLHGFGFWGGKSPAQICAAISGTAELFWLHNLDDCLEIIDTKFYSVQVTMESVVYFILLFSVIQFLYQRLCERMHVRNDPRSPIMYLLAPPVQNEQTTQQNPQL